MSNAPNSPSFDDGDSVFSRGLPSSWAWLAALAILAIGLYGLYRGITGVQPSAGALISARMLGASSASVEAAPAAALPHDDQWSTLSGPKVLPPTAAKPAKKAESDDDADDSASPADLPAAATAAGQPGDTTTLPNLAQPPADTPPPSPPPGETQ